MSSASWYPRCAIDVRESRCLFLFSLLLVTAAASAPWRAPVPAAISWLFVIALLPAALSQVRWARGELSRIAWQSDGRWVLVDRRGREHEDARLLPGIFVGARLLVLHWRCRACRRKFRAALLPDNCDPDDFRRLVMRLRLTADAELFSD
ncbi:MAG TPA: protein YgfX [Gammaproteobacteria bacterium]